MELKWLLQNPQFREKPVDINTFVYSEFYLNLPAKQVRPRIMKILGEIFSGILDEKKYNEAIVVGAIGTGKSFVSSICMTYLLYILGCFIDPQKFFGLAPGSSIQLMNMSINEKQARAVMFGDIKARIDNSPWFKNRFMYDTNVQSELKFPRKIYIIPGNSQETFFEGYNIFGGVIDEADSHVRTPDKDCAEEGYNAIIKRMTSRFGNRGLLMVIGSPKSKHGFLVNKYNETEKDKRVFRDWIPYWESPSPSMHYSGETFEYRGLDIPIEHKPDWDRNPEKAMRDLAAVPSEAVEPFFAWSEKIEENANPDRMSPVLPTKRWKNDFKCTDGKPRVCHIDLGINRNKGDACGFACGCIDKWILQDGENVPIIKIDLMERLTAVPGSEIMIADVRQRVYELIKRGFNIIQVTFDGWQSTESIQQLKKRKIESDVLSVDKDTVAYEALKEAIYEDRLDYYYYKPFIEECQQLELVDGNKVDHRPKGSKDVSDAVAGVVFNLMNNKKAQKNGFITFRSWLGGLRISPQASVRSNDA